MNCEQQTEKKGKKKREKMADKASDFTRNGCRLEDSSRISKNALDYGHEDEKYWSNLWGAIGINELILTPSLSLSQKEKGKEKENKRKK